MLFVKSLTQQIDKYLEKNFKKERKINPISKTDAPAIELLSELKKSFLYYFVWDFVAIFVYLSFDHLNMKQTFRFFLVAWE